MGSVILQAEKLNLPEEFAVKLRGKKVELSESGNNIVIKPVSSPISAARGMLKGGNFGTDKLMEQKQLEKELEYGK